jgi:transposase
MIPVDFNSQLSPGTFEFTLDYLIENEMDMSIFDHRYNNDDTGASAYNPKILLKVILMAYSRGITSSRDIEALCRENIIFMALSRDSRPHFTTIASFVTNLPVEIDDLFGGVLALCDDMGLIGKNMFSLDGCKIPSNASKEMSGTKESFSKKAEKMKRVVQKLKKKHREEDENDGPSNSDIRKAEDKQVDALKKKTKKLKKWLKENKDRRGKRNKVVQSNITDNDSAKLKTSSDGVIQGYNGIAMNDDKHQVIVAADAIGQNDERPTVQPMVEEARKRFEKDPFETAKLTADNGFCDESNLEYLYNENINAYIPDKDFRKRDKRFKDADKHYPKERKKKPGKFHPEDFIVDPVNETVNCPAGKKMWKKSGNPKAFGVPAIQFRAHAGDCKACSFRRRCLRKEDQKTPRTFVWFKTNDPKHQPYTKRMAKKIDTEEGRYEYSKRLGTIEPVFANITSNLGLKWFSLRGKTKVRAQWLLFCLVHNIGKIQRYGTIC